MENGLVHNHLDEDKDKGATINQKWSKLLELSSIQCCYWKNYKLARSNQSILIVSK